MATYSELHGLNSDDDLRNKVEVAITKKAQILLDKTAPTSAEVTWANQALQSPRAKAESILRYILAKNSALSLAQITGAGDSTIQDQVDPAVDALILGGTV